MSKGLLIFISGPGGVGKSTVCRRLALELPAEFAVSSTTRAGKPQDAHGKKYLFVTNEEFTRQLEAGEFLEYAQVFGHWYGTLKRPVEDALANGRDVLLEIDVQGAIQVHKLFPESLGIFVLPPSEDDLLKRLRDRGRDDEETIQRRFHGARAEIQAAHQSGVYDLMVINKDQGVAETVDLIKVKVQQTKLRQQRSE
jgi:guanylate kinase